MLAQRTRGATASERARGWPSPGLLLKQASSPRTLPPLNSHPHGRPGRRQRERQYLHICLIKVMDVQRQIINYPAYFPPSRPPSRYASHHGPNHFPLLPAESAESLPLLRGERAWGEAGWGRPNKYVLMKCVLRPVRPA